jgi:hypothetical protein
MTPTWIIEPYGPDLIIKNCLASWFGGANDPDDDGETSSGINTKANPDILGCALPFPTCAATFGSPLPVMPYLTTFVEVMGPLANLYLPVIDDGPALDEDRLPDLTPRAFELCCGDLRKGLVPVTIRIIGAAHYLNPIVPRPTALQSGPAASGGKEVA